MLEEMCLSRLPLSGQFWGPDHPGLKPSAILLDHFMVKSIDRDPPPPPITFHLSLITNLEPAPQPVHNAPAMPELTTYLIPATQLFFFIVLAIVWLIGFIRKRNFGFLLLAFVTLAEGALSVARQGFINYLVFHSGSNVTNTQQTLQLLTTTTLIVYVFLWILAIVAAILIVLQRPKPPVAPGEPPVVG
jgi:hypothetical protein